MRTNLLEPNAVVKEHHHSSARTHKHKRAWHALRHAGEHMHTQQRTQANTDTRRHGMNELESRPTFPPKSHFQPVFSQCSPPAPLPLPNPSPHLLHPPLPSPLTHTHTHTRSPPASPSREAQTDVPIDKPQRPPQN